MADEKTPSPPVDPREVPSEAEKLIREKVLRGIDRRRRARQKEDK
jgi:hypothetical protein